MPITGAIVHSWRMSATRWSSTPKAGSFALLGGEAGKSSDRDNRDNRQDGVEGY